ncbi:MULTISPECIES: FAD-dependent oxidoreductase [Roseomonadaceae]|uniref:FAD-dependent oxidoreductase n=1 Tax=Falsiroseomonas oleicola TaxID=2801474 RepID=A0ABS6H8S1_9PROT|nr:FAD-dependent oxidoreductase [Roseomonas oleicola]MBU8545105.1 FAD-dependent oxidoreductase [Roseomonas oleicola]
MRLTHAAIRPSAEAMGITFDGRPIPALKGETVAAALSAAGELTLRYTHSGAPRGLHCGMGACFDCLVTIDGRANQRACLAKVAPGMVVESAVPAQPAPLATRPEGQAPQIECDLLVVGSGPAGLSAAIAAAEAGCTVIALDERDAPGGQYLKPLAASHSNAAPDRQFRQGAALRQRALDAGVTFHFGATVWGGFAADEIGALVEGCNTRFRPRRLVIAAGAHERPVPIPGWTLPGVMTTGCLQTLARANRVSPGDSVVIAGNGPLNLQLACELVEGGVRVAAVLEAAPFPGLSGLRQALRLAAAAPDLAWDGARYLAVLRRAKVPVIWGARPIAAEGEGRFAALRARTPTGQIRIEADALALNLGFQPETGLARALGCAHRFVDSGLGRLETVTDEDGRTSIPEVFAVGDGAQVGGARIAFARGRLAGLAAARDLLPGLPDDTASRRALARAIGFQDALWRFFAVPEFDARTIADTTTVCRCEEVTAGTLREAMALGATSLGAVKKATRAGMGRCQGRMCGASVARIVGASEEAGWAAPRAPLKPVPAIALAMEKPEWLEGPSATPRPILPSHHIPATGPAETCDVLVVGGGALGLSTALYCAREGLSVIVAERGEPGQGATTANAGSLHIQLHAYDSAGAEEGPESAAAQILTIGPASVALWREIAAEAGEGLGIRTEGGIMLAETPDQLRRLVTKVAMERDFGVDSRVLGANELMDVAPYLAPGFAGAAFCAPEGQMDPLRGLSALLRLVQRAGALVRGGTTIAAVAREGAGFRAETVAGGVIRAGHVVNACGPWAGEFAKMLGAPIPVGAAVQQVMVTEAAGGEIMRHLVLHGSRHLSAKQGDAGHLVLGGAWPGVLDAAGRPRNLAGSIEGNLFVASTVLPALAGLQVIRAWTGLNVQVPGPILGADPRVPGLHHAVTFNGWTLGPVCGRLVAGGICGRAGAGRAFGVGRF